MAGLAHQRTALGDTKQENKTQMLQERHSLPWRVNNHCVLSVENVASTEGTAAWSDPGDQIVSALKAL